MTPKNCGCCTCVIFTDSFTGSSLDSWWTVHSGSMTVNTTDDNAEIASGAVIGPTTNQPSGSGGLSASIGLARDTAIIRFAYADSNNHWKMTTEASTLWIAMSGGSPVVIDTILCKFYEVIGGSEEFIGSRHVAYNESSGAPTLASCSFCWHEGGRVRVIITPTSGLTGVELHWPNHVTGGNSFRIEPDYDLTIDGVTWAYHTIEHSGVSGCLCSTYNCLKCVDSWGDTMDLLVVGGANDGQTVTVDRHRAAPTTDAYLGQAQNNLLSYWQFWYRVEYDISGSIGGDGQDWLVDLNFCFGSSEADSDGQLSMTNLDGGPFVEPHGTVEFTTSDCEGPFEADFGGGVTVEMTPSAP